MERLDFFPKTIDEFRVKTVSGSIVSIISMILMSVIFVGELRFYLKTETINTLYVNTTRINTLKASFDLSFPDIACKIISIDAVDESGRSQSNAIYEIYKHRLTPTGEKHGSPEEVTNLGHDHFEDVFDKLTTDHIEMMNQINAKTACGNCYGAGEESECCNTCESVKQAYKRRGWRFKPAGIIQCNSEAYITNAREQFAIDGGCQVYGTLQLETSGNFHVTANKKILESSQLKTNTDAIEFDLSNLLELLTQSASTYNLTHSINSLTFGDHFPGINSPLDGEIRTLDSLRGMYQYYLKIVPTKYESYDGKEIESNTYAVTEHFRKLGNSMQDVLPGVYFYYNISPIQAKFIERRGSVMFRFLTSIFALVGGSYTFMGIVDLFITYMFKSCGNQGVLK